MIDPQLWERVKELLDSCLDLEPRERARWLDQACGGDAELRREVESLLALVESKRGSDSYAYMARHPAIDPAHTYRVATTDFMARVAAGYKDYFKEAKGSGVKVREQVQQWLAKQ